jgi:phosphatidate cytidylyltransferase
VGLSDLAIRTAVGVVGIPLLLACTFAGGLVFFLLIVLITLLSIRELARFYASEKGVGPIRLIGSVGAVALLTDGWLWAGAHWGWLLIAGTGLIMLIEIFRNDPRPEAVIGGTLVSWLYLAIPLTHFIWLRGAEGILGVVDGAGLLLALALWLIVWFSDTFAYLVGRRWGRHKMIPAVSPNKTWEGTVAGLLTAALTGVVITLVLPSLEWNTIFGMVTGLVIGIAAVLGDLAESRLKRGVGVKDSGTTLPGHGGILDRFDSIIFCAPVFYYLLML